MTTARFPTGKPRRRRRENTLHTTHREPTDLSRWIEEKGIKVSVLAARLGVTPKTVYYWASGFRVPDLVSAFRVQTLTEGDVDVASFLKTRLARRIWEDLVDHSSGEGHAS